MLVTRVYSGQYFLQIPYLQNESCTVCKTCTCCNSNNGIWYGTTNPHSAPNLLVVDLIKKIYIMYNDSTMESMGFTSLGSFSVLPANELAQTNPVRLLIFVIAAINTAFSL